MINDALKKKDKNMLLMTFLLLLLIKILFLRIISLEKMYICTLFPSKKCKS